MVQMKRTRPVESYPTNCGVYLSRQPAYGYNNNQNKISKIIDVVSIPISFMFMQNTNVGFPLCTS